MVSDDGAPKGEGTSGFPSGLSLIWRLGSRGLELLLLAISSCSVLMHAEALRSLVGLLLRLSVLQELSQREDLSSVLEALRSLVGLLLRLLL